MLNILRRIVQKLNEADSIEQALKVLVTDVRQAMDTGACTVFLLDPTRENYVLMATEGLNEKAIGKTIFPTSVGVVGEVGKRGEPLNLADATTHPSFYHYPGIGEETYKAFLGVPIIHQRQLLGVLVAEQKQPRCFDESEVAFMVTISAQLAGIIAHAEATGKISGLNNKANKKSNKDTIINGIPGASGVAIGSAVITYPLANLDAVPDRETDNPKKEIAEFNRAVASARKEIKQLSEQIANTLPPEEHALFAAYLNILESSSIHEEVLAQIHNGHWAQAALRNVVTSHIRQFEAMEDEYLRERATDLKDLGNRVLAHLQSRKQTRPEYPERTILVGEEVTASALAEVPEGKLAGIVSGRGSGNSHVAILARALGIPAVMGIGNLKLTKLEKQELIVDGYYGQIYLNPSKQLSKQFQRLADEERELDAELKQFRDQPAETQDEHRIFLYVNTGLETDIGRSLSVGAEGVGLYRTEVPFLSRERFPSEEEQRVVYQQMLKAFSPRPVTMRTLDIGGDKALPYFPVEEENPFLGWRGIRIMLDHPELFLTQVRAMLRASVGLNNLQIMLPMISGMQEVTDAKRLIRQAHQELVDDGFDLVMPAIGVMVEVPSAVYLSRDLARNVDFLSVGSNDLTQYLLAVDRNNGRVANLYDSLHPSVLHALKHVVNCAKSEGKPISLCGEMASDPAAIPLLLALGFDSLSVNASSLLRIKWVVRQFTLQYAQQLLEETLIMDNSVKIRNHVNHALDQLGLGGLIRAGRR